MRENVKILFYMIHLLGNDKQQVVTDGNTYLCKDSILCRSEERLDVQVLFNPLEELMRSFS